MWWFHSPHGFVIMFKPRLSPNDPLHYKKQRSTYSLSLCLTFFSTNAIKYLGQQRRVYSLAWIDWSLPGTETLRNRHHTTHKHCNPWQCWTPDRDVPTSPKRLLQTTAATIHPRPATASRHTHRWIATPNRRCQPAFTNSSSGMLPLKWLANSQFRYG